MLQRSLVFGLAVMLFGAASIASAKADPRGLWLAEDGAKVRVSSCGGSLCATLAEAKSRVDPETGRPWTDKNNSDPAQRNRPLVGVAVLRSLQPMVRESGQAPSTTLRTAIPMRAIFSMSAPGRFVSKAARSVFAAAGT